MASLFSSIASAFGELPFLRANAITNKYDSDVSTADTIQIMSEVVRNYQHNPVVGWAVNQAVKGLSPDATDKETVRAIYYWVKRTVTFCEDEAIMKGALGIADQDLDKDLLITPDLLLSMPTPMGDCDDYSTLLATMLTSLGFQCWFVTIAADDTMPGKWSHVYVKVRLDDTGVEQYLDSSHGLIPGWEHKQYTRKKEWII